MQSHNETTSRKCASISPTLYFLPSLPITLEVCIQTYWGTYAPTLEAAELWSKALVDLKAVRAFVDVDIWLLRAMKLGRKHQRNTRSWCSIINARSKVMVWLENQSMICAVTVLLHVDVSRNSKILISCLQKRILHESTIEGFKRVRWATFLENSLVSVLFTAIARG